MLRLLCWLLFIVGTSAQLTGQLWINPLYESAPGQYRSNTKTYCHGLKNCSATICDDYIDNEINIIGIETNGFDYCYDRNDSSLCYELIPYFDGSDIGQNDAQEYSAIFGLVINDTTNAYELANFPELYCTDNRNCIWTICYLYCESSYITLWGIVPPSKTNCFDN